MTYKRNTIALLTEKILTLGLFEKLKYICKDNLTLVATSDNNLKRTCFSRLKDQSPVMLQSNLVYEVCCQCGKKYVGQTKQLLKERLKQHKCVSKKNGLSALTEHIIESNHVPIWPNTRILYKETNRKKREILEMIAIKRNNEYINKQRDTIMLSSTYNNIIKFKSSPPLNR